MKSGLMDKNKKIAVLVAGMHRSGTSAVTRLLSLLGCDLPKTLMDAASSNETGHWESTRIVALNDEILQSAGSVWDDWEPFNPSWYELPATALFRERAQSILRSEFGDSRLFVLKDPRMCRLLPFWLEAAEGFGAEPLVVCPVRNPLDVAKSLEKRDGIEVSVGLLLWLRHVLDSEFASRGQRRAYLRYEHVLSRRYAVADQLEDVLGVRWPNRSSTAELEINRYLSPGLRHHRSDDSSLIADPGLSRWLRSTFAILDRWSNGEICETDTTDLDRTRNAFNEATPTFNTAIAAARISLLERDNQIGRLDQAVVERDNQIGRLDQAVVERDRQIARLNQATAARDRRLEELGRSVEDRGRHVEQLNQAAAERDRRLDELEHALTERDEAIAQILSSNSWKLTRPMRSVRHCVRHWLTRRTVKSPRQQHVAIALGRWVYHRLPLSPRARIQLRLLLTKHAPWAVRVAHGLPSTAPPRATSSIVPSKVSAHDIVLPSSAEPVVSIIIPMYGKVDYTLRCLYSIAENVPSINVEVIVVDDCSPDTSSEVLQSVRGLRVVTRPQNGGYIEACNDGACEARGIYLHFLNNDTEVTAGWLDELVRTFTLFPGAGLVGSKLVYPDGRLQEAGGIIWRDGSAWNVGRQQDPLQPAFNYARDVDYCSGASLILPKILFDELGGFDRHYRPAYGEDSDLALKVRDRGYHVIYQPLSVVMHHEGITSGTNITEGTKSYQSLNAKKLYERWHEHLQHHPECDADVAKERYVSRRALVLDECTPTPDQDAGSVTALNMMLLLREHGFQVTFIPASNYLFLPQYTPLLQRSGIETLHAPYCTSVDHHLKESGHRYALVLMFRVGVAHRHLDSVQTYCPRAKTIFHASDLHFLRMRREFELDGNSYKRDEYSK